jgi:hypothetical protein
MKNKAVKNQENDPWEQLEKCEKKQNLHADRALGTSYKCRTAMTQLPP